MNARTKKQTAFWGMTVMLAATTLSMTPCHAHGFHPGTGFITPERIQQVIEWKLNDFMATVDATPEQREQIRALADRLIARGAAMHLEMAGNHKALFDEWKSDTPDMTRINSILDDAAERKAVFAREVAAAVVELHGILSPEQRAQITEFIETHHAGRHGASLH